MCIRDSARPVHILGGHLAVLDQTADHLVGGHKAALAVGDGDGVQVAHLGLQHPGGTDRGLSLIHI